tara:strand:- start:183 stop:350 length:168 start_codon:yes stop_codon:yes gene_type:complete
MISTGAISSEADALPIPKGLASTRSTLGKVSRIEISPFSAWRIVVGWLRILRCNA